MNSIESIILNRYEQKEVGSYYDAVQKVVPNYTVYPKHNEKIREHSFMEITAEGVVRRRGKSLRERHLKGEP